MVAPTMADLLAKKLWKNRVAVSVAGGLIR
jgi:hypothetical protein